MRGTLAVTIPALLVGLVAGCSPGQEDDPAATPSPTAEPTPEPTPTPTDDAGAGDAAVAVLADGRVVVLDPASGEERRELLDGVPVDDPAGNDVAVTPDGSDAFVVVPPTDPQGDSEIVRLPVDGGTSETVAHGTVPAVSPDGDTLAYVRTEDAGPGDDEVALPEPVLVLHDLASGEETPLARDQPFHFIADVGWTADGSDVVFTAGEIFTGLYAVDRAAASLDDARRLGPDVEQGSEETSWGPVTALGDDRLAVVETCCDPPTEERWTIITVDVGDGGTDGAPLLEERIEATDLDSGRDARRLLIVVRGGPEGGELLRWDGEGNPERVADGVVSAAW